MCILKKLKNFSNLLNYSARNEYIFLQPWQLETDAATSQEE